MLTEHQKEKFEEVVETFKKERFILLTGSAGVGKTYMVNEIIKHYAKQMFNSAESICCAAPTHKALSVLKSKIGPEVIFNTTHQVLRLKRSIDRKTGKEVFKAPKDNKFPPLEGIRLLVVDEASMLPPSIKDGLVSHAIKQGTKILFIGDAKQLPPIGEKISPIFAEGYTNIELLEIIRQKEGNPIVDLSRNLSLIRSGEPIQTEEGNGYIYSNQEDKVIATLAAVNGTDQLKYLAYTNKEVDNINRKVRQAIYGNPHKIELGESLIFNAPYKEDYTNNQEIKVNTIDTKTKEFSFLVQKGYGNVRDSIETAELKVYSINKSRKKIVNPNADISLGWKSSSFIYEDIDNILVIHEDSEEDFNKISAYLKSQASLSEIPWTEWYRFTEQFANLTYNHALTVHKSQGSTFEQAIINIEDINKNFNANEKTKMLYTAITRASDLVILYKVK